MEDVDVTFENIMLAENRAREESYRKGEIEGRMQGLTEGRKLGREKGEEIGGEIGFYAGFGEACLKISSKQSLERERAQKCVEQLVNLTTEFPVDDPTNPQLQEKLEKIRAKFKQVTSLLNIKLEYKTEQGPKLAY